jgi:anti-sigma B factor antagonist
VAREKTQRMRVSAQDGVTVVELTERRILDELAISEIGDQLKGLIAQAPTPRMIVDFTAVAHMSSSALGMLITLHKHVREKGGQLRLCGIGPAIYEVFVITRLNEIFQICKSREEAIQTLQ